MVLFVKNEKVVLVLKKHLFVLFLSVFTISLLAACNSTENNGQDLLFKSQGEKWEAEVYTGKVIEPEVKENEPYVYFKPKGENSAEIKSVEYKLESDQGSLGGGDVSLNEQIGAIALKNENITKVVTSETKEVKATLNWLENNEKKTEVIILEKQ